MPLFSSQSATAKIPFDQGWATLERGDSRVLSPSIEEGRATGEARGKVGEAAVTGPMEVAGTVGMKVS
jgi:hypothetical protein